MPTIIIDGNNYEALGDVAGADIFLAADFGATKWRAEADPEQKGRAIVSAQRIIDRQCYVGDKVASDQANAFPRTNMGLDDWPDGVTPQPVIDALYTMAKLIHAGMDIENDSSPDQSGIKRQKAGSVEVEYFIPTDDPSRFPTSVLELLGPFMCGSEGIGGTIASGVCEPSAFRQGYGLSGSF